MKILVAMSGGVDSSVAAGLLCAAGHTCIGCTMKLYSGPPNEEESIGKTCCTLADTEDARSVCRKLGMPYYVFNFTDDFTGKVIRPFAEAYRRGETPNPCLCCNREMKFGKLYGRADILSCDRIATGHYARIGFENGRYVLKKAKDLSKDQSYVLYTMTQAQLSRTLFPLGELTGKAEVRRIAEESGFINAGKPDSQDICFVPNGDYARVIAAYTGTVAPAGDFTDTEGRVLGRHKGIDRYTVGQHKGLGLVTPEKLYVVAICPESNTVVLGREAALYRREVFVRDCNWIAGYPPPGEIRCRVKLRYRQPEQPATVVPLPAGGAFVRFDTPQRAITPGQAAVFYEGDTVLGGGTVEKNGEEKGKEGDPA